MNERRLSSLLDAIPDPEPTPETVERHRRALRELIDQPSTSTDKNERGSRWGRVAVAAGFVVLLATAVAVMTLYSSRDRNSEISADSPAQSPGTAPTLNEGCAAFANEHPVDVPPGFSGPKDVAVADSPNPPAANQTVRTWKSGTTEIEARWPVDPAAAGSLPAPSAATSGFVPPFPGVMPSMGLTSDGNLTIRQTSTGRSYLATLYRLNELSETCESVQVIVFDQDPNKVGPWAFNLSFESGVPLVTSSQAADAAPSVTPCPANLSVSDAVGATYPTPEAALEAFVRPERGRAQDDWAEFRLPDGSVAYAHKVLLRDTWYASLHVAKVGDGWAIDHTELCV